MRMVSRTAMASANTRAVYAMRAAGRTAKSMDSENGSSPFQKSPLQVSSVILTRVAGRMVISMEMESKLFGGEN